MRKFAHYGPTDRYPGPPMGGMCISVFAILRREGKVLMGVPKGEKKWVSEWVPGWGTYSKEDRREVFRQWRLPSSNLLEGEHPDDAIGRVMKDQLRLGPFKRSPFRLLSYSTPSDWYPGNVHWDLAFAYEVEAKGPVKRPPWWGELKFLSLRGIGRVELGWNDDFMRDLELVG